MKDDFLLAPRRGCLAQHRVHYLYRTGDFRCGCCVYVKDEDPSSLREWEPIIVKEVFVLC